MKIIFDILGAIPFWAYFILAYILYAGYRARKPAKIRWFRLIILPAIFLYFSLTNLFSSSFQFFIRDLNWIIFTALGIYSGWLYIKNKQIQVDKIKKRMRIPEDKLFLYLLIAIFLVKYAFGCVEDLNSDLKDNGFFIFIKIAISSFLIGILIGRNGTLLYKYIKAPHSSIAKKK